MKPESHPEKTSYEPRMATRLAWWFGLYLAGALTTFAVVSHKEGEASFLELVFFVFLAEPVGLGKFMMYVVGGSDVVTRIIVIFGLCFYPLHLLLSLVVRGKRSFYILMAALIGALIISWIGAVEVDNWRITPQNGFHETPPLLPNQ